MATASSSRESTSPTSSEGEQPPEKVKATTKGKEPTQKRTANAALKAVSAAKPKGKRALEEQVNVAMPPRQNTAAGSVKPQASLKPASTSASNVSLAASVAASVPRPIAARVEEVSSASE